MVKSKQNPKVPHSSLATLSEGEAPKNTKLGSSQKGEKAATKKKPAEDKKKSKDKEHLSKEKRLNYLLRLAYSLNEPYPGSAELKFVDKVVGNRGGDIEGAIDNKMALSKAHQVFSELEKLMKSKISFHRSFELEHDWSSHFEIEAVHSVRKQYASFQATPDVPYVDSDTKPYRQIKTLVSQFKTQYAVLLKNIMASGTGNDADIDCIWNFRNPKGDSTVNLHPAIVGYILYNQNLAEREAVLETNDLFEDPSSNDDDEEAAAVVVVVDGEEDQGGKKDAANDDAVITSRTSSGFLVQKTPNLQKPVNNSSDSRKLIQSKFNDLINRTNRSTQFAESSAGNMSEMMLLKRFEIEQTYYEKAVQAASKSEEMIDIEEQLDILKKLPEECKDVAKSEGLRLYQQWQLARQQNAKEKQDKISKLVKPSLFSSSIKPIVGVVSSSSSSSSSLKTVQPSSVTQNKNEIGEEDYYSSTDDHDDAMEEPSSKEIVLVEEDDEDSDVIEDTNNNNETTATTPIVLKDGNIFINI